MMLALPAGSALADRFTYNSSGSWVQADAWLSDGSSVYVYTHDDGASAYLSRYEEIVCPDGSFGSRYTDAFGPAMFTYDRRFTAAQADGILDVFVYEDCGGGGREPEPRGPTDSGTLALSLGWTGNGDLVRSRGSWSEKIPGEYNSHSRYSSTYRYQTVAGMIGDTAVTGEGTLGEVRWSDHSNGK